MLIVAALDQRAKSCLYCGKKERISPLKVTHKVLRDDKPVKAFAAMALIMLFCRFLLASPECVKKATCMDTFCR